MNNVRAITPHLTAVEVPEELREIPAWLIWRFEQYEDEPKPRKVPYWADGSRRHGQQGGSVDRARLTTFVAARDAAVRMGYDGVGFAPLPGCGYTFLDFDNCVGVDGSLPPEVRQIVGRTYAEYSPSGKGIRAALKGDLGNRKSKATEDQYGFETFSSSGFVTFTGNILPLSDMVVGPNYIARVDDRTAGLAEARFGSAQPQVDADPEDFMLGREPRLGLSVEQMEELLDALDPDMGRDDWIRVGMALHHECHGDDTGFELWDEWSAGGYTYPGTEGLRTQWDSFERRAGQRRRQITMATVIKMAKDAGVRPNQAASVEQAQERAAQLAAEFDVAHGTQSPEGYEGRFPIHSAATLGNAPPVEWWIKGVIPRADLFMIYGASGSGKSFVAIDMAAHIALGLPWRGLRVEKGRVVIIAAEGAGGYGARFKAWCLQYGYDLEELDVGVITVPPNFMEREDISDLVASIKLLGDVGLIFVDTLAQVTPGANENSSEDMGLALANCRVLGAATGASVGIVHHSGKDLTRGARGWSGARAAVDAEIEVSKPDDGSPRMIRITKQKDGADNGKFAFKLMVVPVGVDRYGEEVSSCVAIPTEVQEHRGETAATLRGLGRVEAHLLEVMTFFPTESAVKLAEFIDKAVDTMPEPEPGARDTRRQKVVRALRSLSRTKDAPLHLEGNVVIFYE